MYMFTNAKSGRHKNRHKLLDIRPTMRPDKLQMGRDNENLDCIRQSDGRKLDNVINVGNKRCMY